MTLPTNRPFFSNFLAAFRAQSALQKGAGAASGTSTTSAFAQSSATTATSTLTASANGARSLSTKASSQPQAIAAGAGARQSGHQFQPTRQHAASPLSRSPGGPASPGYHTPIGSRQRRGSDSSSEGFKDALGGEKWYIGGRAPNGEETFYKLSMVKRPRSVDRLSMDRLSL